jgi:hypothetical protein
MDARPRPRARIHLPARFRLPLVMLAIAAVTAPAGFAFAQGSEPTDPAVNDPALDPANWKDAEIVRTPCAPVTEQDNPSADCWVAKDFPETEPDMPMPWPERRFYCEDAPQAVNAAETVCEGNPIPDDIPSDKAAVLEAYGVDRDFTPNQ